MEKQYCIEWSLKSGRTGWKSIGHNCPEEAIKQMNRKIKNKSCASVSITWNYVGEDVPDEEIGCDYFYQGVYKTKLNIFGCDVYIDNDIKEM